MVLLQAILETELASTSSQMQHLQQQLEAVERNRTDLEASWLRNRRLNHAARIIQRRYRLWRSRNHVAKFGRDAEVCGQLIIPFLHPSIPKCYLGKCQDQVSKDVLDGGAQGTEIEPW